MPSGIHDIKKRIKSIKNTRQVTKAMEAVSASKMRKATEQAVTTRQYSSLGWQLIQNLSLVTDESQHPLLKAAVAPQKILLIFITSDKGLCGGLNSQVIRQMDRYLQEHPVPQIDIISIGKKGQYVLKKLRRNIVGAYEGLTDQPSIIALRPIAQTALAGFQSGQYDQVQIIFTDFKSALTQQPVIRQLLPLQKEALENIVGADKDNQVDLQPTTSQPTEYIFEPNPKELLDAVLPRLLEVQIYQAVLESAASEHSARMLAMRNATDSANEMIKDLTLTFNQARQASITQEIAEIAAGRAALEN